MTSESPPAVDTGPGTAVRRAVFFVAILMLAVQVGPLYYCQGDAPGYISIARHIARGDGLLNHDSPVLWYPPGYSLLISPLFCLGDLPLLAISAFHFLLAMALMCGVYLWAKRFAPAGALWAAVITVGSAGVWIHYRRPVSELAFMAVSIWAVVCLESAVKAVDRKRFVALLLTVMLLFAMTGLIRSIGIALAAGAGCRLGLAAFKRQIEWRRATTLALAVMLASTLAVGSVVVRDHVLAASMGKAAYLDAVAQNRVPGLAGGPVPWCALVVSEIGRVGIPGMYKSYGFIGAWRDVNMLVYMPYVLLLLAGWVRWLRRCSDVLGWTLPFYLAILTYFRWESGARYWVPMMPVIVVCTWFLLEPLGRRRQPLFAIIWVLHLAAASGYWIASDLPQARALNSLWPEAKAAAAMIDRDRDRVVVANDLYDLGSLLTLEFDRGVGVRPRGDGPVPPGTRWLILPAKATGPQGFALRGRLNEDCIWQRE